MRIWSGITGSLYVMSSGCSISVLMYPASTLKCKEWVPFVSNVGVHLMFVDTKEIVN